MNTREDIRREHQRRWLRPNAHLYWRPDAARFLPAHLHNLLPPQLRPSPHDGYDRAHPNIATWTGKRGRRVPDPIMHARGAAARSARVEILRRERKSEEARTSLLDLKWQIVALRFFLAARKYLRALPADREHARKAGFRPDQPRWPAGSGRISGRRYRRRRDRRARFRW